MFGRLSLTAGLVASNAPTATVEPLPAGQLRDGTGVSAVVLTNGNGVTARILTYGAMLQSLIVPDRNGRGSDVVLGHDSVAEYESYRNFLGVTVGRYANRIADGRFALDGRTFDLSRNDGSHSLHGGADGFDCRNWRIGEVRSGAVASVSLDLHSPDGDGGYPGNLDVTVTYAMDGSGALTITFEARTDRPTIVNLTNHAIFDLSSGSDQCGVAGHRLTIPASAYLPVDAALIPTGEMRPVAGSPFDFRTGRTIGDGLREGADEQIVRGRGYDHTLVIDAGLTAQPKLVARLEHQETARTLDVLSTEPGLQVYSGNCLDGMIVGKGGRVYRMGDGMALEPQKFPDSPNRPDWPGARLDPGETYRHVMIYRPGLATRSA